MISLFKQVIFRFHVNLAGCTLIELSGFFEPNPRPTPPRQHRGRGFARKPVRQLAVPDSTCVTRKGCTTPAEPVEYHNTTSSQVHRLSFRKLEEHVQKTRPSKHVHPLKNSHVFPVFRQPKSQPTEKKKSLTPPAKETKQSPNLN